MTSQVNCLFHLDFNISNPLETKFWDFCLFVVLITLQKGGCLIKLVKPHQDFMHLFIVRRCQSVMHFCVVKLLFQFEYEVHSVTVSFNTLLLGAFLSLVRSVLTLTENLLVISESILKYFLFRLYAVAYVVFYHIHSCSIANTFI